MKLIKILSRKIENCILLHLVFWLILLLILGYIWLTLLSNFLNSDIKSILKTQEVLAVIVVALPTLLIWSVDINNKNIENKSENFNMYFDIQNSLEEKYTKLKDEVKEFLEKEDLKKDIRINLNQLDKIEKFIDDLEYFKEETKIKSSFYQIDLFYFFKVLNVFNNNVENKDVDKKIGKIKGRIMKYTLTNCSEDSLMEKVYLLTEEGTFSYIDFRNLGDLTKFDFEGNPTFSFKYCKIDLNNFSGFIKNNIELEFFDCRFYKGNKEITRYCNKEYLEQNYNITLKDKKEDAKEEESIENNEERVDEIEELLEYTEVKVSKFEVKEKNIEESMLMVQKEAKNRKEKSGDSIVRFVDNRSNIALNSLNEDIYFSIEMDHENYSNGKIVKHELNSQIKDKLADKRIDNKDISIRYSKDYSDKPELNGKVKWQSWHSIDLPVLDVKNELTIKSIDNIQSGYAFVTEKDKDFHILFFTKKQFKKLLEEKIEKNAYTVYKNAQLKDCVKFNFYFAELLNEISIQNR